MPKLQSHGLRNFGNKKENGMKAVDKTALLAQLENTVENHLQVVVHDFQNRSEEELNKPSVTGGWSVAQCLEHLNSYGRFYLPELQKALSKAGRVEQKEFKSTWLGGYFKEMMDPKTSTRKYRAFKNHIPSASLEAGKVVAEFIQQQEELLGYLRMAHDRDLNKRIPISITRFIRLKMGDVFQFLIAHDERHLKQAKRNLL